MTLDQARVNRFFLPGTSVEGLPYGLFRELRATAPVCRVEEPPVGNWPAGPGYWAVLRDADAKVAPASARPCSVSWPVSPQQGLDLLGRGVGKREPGDHLKVLELGRARQDVGGEQGPQVRELERPTGLAGLDGHPQQSGAVRADCGAVPGVGRR
ncbi:hypothetical protein [Saccharothrix sp. ST-888]|uniref:hypothetical protein n=1 Tax=Saccharothrix sp. ST-888 TaxID=1427391 RepID=UPI0005ECF3DA|nr:hypothetical protein [Saccharothrix sp. ST-888]KJK58924.1 hypothetical protein UK12_07455 [Saccharothrix sp. ST-888]